MEIIVPGSIPQTTQEKRILAKKLQKYMNSLKGAGIKMKLTPAGEKHEKETIVLPWNKSRTA